MMKYIYFYTLVVFSLFTLLQCTTSSEHNLGSKHLQDTVHIDFIPQRGVDISVLIDTLVSIPLETTEKSILGKVEKMIVSENLIYILDNEYSKAVFVFDLEGQFQYKIFRFGKGPGEYSEIFDMDVDNKYLYILDSGRKMIRFDKKTGNFHSEQVLQQWMGMEFVVDNTGKQVFYEKGFRNSEDFDENIRSCQIYQSNYFGTYKNCAIPFDSRFNAINFYPNISFAKNQDEILLLPAYTYDYFTHKDEKIKRLYHFDFGDHNMDIEQIFEIAKSNPDNISNYMFANPVVGHLLKLNFTRNYLTIVYSYHQNDLNLIIDRNRGEVVVGGVGVRSSPEYQIGIPMPEAACGEYFYSVLDAYDFIKYDEDEQFDLTNLKVDSDRISRTGENNPILLRYRLRENNEMVYKYYKGVKEYFENAPTTVQGQ